MQCLNVESAVSQSTAVNLGVHRL